MKVALPFDEKPAYGGAGLRSHVRGEAVPAPLQRLNPETCPIAILTVEAAPCDRPAQAILPDAIHRMCMGAS